MAFEKRHLARVLENVLLIAIIVTVWLVMILPVVIYFLPLNNAGPSSSSAFDNISAADSEMASICQNLQAAVTVSNINSSTGDGNGTGGLVCQENFFLDPVSGLCKPSCSSWLMFSRSDTIVSRIIIGTCTVIGIFTTVVIVILSFVRFRNMLVFPSVLILYQDIIVSVHGVNILIGFIDRSLYCTSEDLIESYSSSASPYCTISGLISGQVVLPLAIWITIQISYTLLAVRSPFYFKRLTMNKRKGHILHIVSLLVGGISLLVPFFLVLGLGGFSLIDTIFPPIICIARNRDISAYVILIPLGILTAVIITQLILILHQLLRSHCMNKMSSKNNIIKKAEIKVFIICFCYVILGLGASLAYSISSAFLDDHQRELMDYFECELCGVNSGQVCDRSEFERFTNPPLITIGYSLFVLYPVITLVYVVSLKRKSQTSHAQNDVATKSSS